MNFRTFSIAAILIASTLGLVSEASFRNLPEKPETYKVGGYSRPCCSFVPSIVAKMMGIAGFVDPRHLGEHHFGKPGKVRPSERVGMTYTCRAGFIDISHLRDNADWAAHILQLLMQEIGSGQQFKVRHEGGVEDAVLVLPEKHREALRALTPDQLKLVARALAYDFALLHEVATAFPMAVSMARIPLLTEKLWNERSSSFSVEDSYSNYLGATLGSEAALDPRPYNEAMTTLLDDALAERGVVSLQDAKRVFQSIKGKWWKGGVFKGFKQVKKRVFVFEGELEPRIPETRVVEQICPGTIEPVVQEIADIQKVTGFPANEVAYLKIRPNRQYAHFLSKDGAIFDEQGYMTRESFPVIIPRIHAEFRKKLHAGMDTN